MTPPSQRCSRSILRRSRLRGRDWGRGAGPPAESTAHGPPDTCPASCLARWAATSRVPSDSEPGALEKCPLRLRADPEPVHTDEQTWAPGSPKLRQQTQRSARCPRAPQAEPPSESPVHRLPGTQAPALRTTGRREGSFLNQVQVHGDPTQPPEDPAETGGPTVLADLPPRSDPPCPAGWSPGVTPSRGPCSKSQLPRTVSPRPGPRPAHMEGRRPLTGFAEHPHFAPRRGAGTAHASRRPVRQPGLCRHGVSCALTNVP